MGYWQDKLDAYRNDPNFGCYDIGSKTDYEYQRLKEAAEQEAAKDERRGDRR